MKKTILILAATAALAACDKDSGDTPTDDNPLKTIEMTESYTNLSEGNAVFAFSLLKALYETDGEEEEFTSVSPLSAAFALSMIANGASESTLDELLAMLGADENGLDDLNSYCNTLISELPGLDKTTTIKLANSLWYKPSFPILQTFVSVLDEYYEAESYEIDTENFLNDVNDWCSDKTEGLIKNFYSTEDDIEDLLVLVLNAVYFNGAWEHEFDTANTKQGDFTNYDGTISNVAFMHRKANERYYKGSNYTAASLYFGNEAYCMQIALPNDDSTLSECIETIDREEWGKWIEAYRTGIDIKFPKFSKTYKSSLKQTLTQMGHGEIFGGNYSNLSATDCSFSDVRQETVFSVDEKGATASVITSGEGYETSVDIDYEAFYVDRPFIYLVTETSSDSILIIGYVTVL